jgi:hypothetical protein
VARRSRATKIWFFIDRTNHKKNFESVAKQRFQNFSWFGFERKAL